MDLEIFYHDNNVGAGSPKVSNNVPTLNPFRPMLQKGLQV
jgi:hypothetical protein